MVYDRSAALYKACSYQKAPQRRRFILAGITGSLPPRLPLAILEVSEVRVFAKGLALLRNAVHSAMSKPGQWRRVGSRWPMD